MLSEDLYNQNEDMEIRRMESGDIDCVVELWYETSIAAHDFISSEYWNRNREAMAAQYLPCSETYLAICSNEIVGFISFLDSYLAALFVETSRQGQGVGTFLLCHAKELRSSMNLRVYSKNVRSIGFYLKHGFTVVGEERDNDTGEEELVMVWNR